MLDAPVTIFLLFAVFAFIRSKEDPRWWIAVGFALGLAVMTKGPAAIPAIVAIAIAAAVRRPQPSRHIGLGVAAFIVSASTWHLAMLYLHGHQFFNEYIGNQILRRAA